MSKAIEEIIEFILSLEEPDWLLLKSLQKTIEWPEGFKIEFIERLNSEDLPFGEDEGYLIMEEARSEDVITFVSELYSRLKDSETGLSNLWILVNRIGCNNELNSELIQLLRDLIGDSKSRIIFKVLCDSANKNSFQNLQKYFGEIPQTTSDWINLEHFAGQYHYAYRLAWVLLSILYDTRDCALDDLLCLKPLLLGSYLMYYGTGDLGISAEDVLNISDQTKLSFLGSRVLQLKSSEEPFPKWLTKELIERFIIDKYVTIGAPIVRNVLRSYPSYVKFSLNFDKLKTWVTGTIRTILESYQGPKWIESIIESINVVQDYPHILHFIDRPSEELAILIAHRFFQHICDCIDWYQNNNLENPCGKALQLNEDCCMYNALCSCVTQLFHDDGFERSLTNLTYKILPLFYGNYTSKNLAMQLTELLIISMMGDLTGLNTNQRESFHDNLKNIAKILMPAYVHTAERTNAIWDPTFQLLEFVNDRSRWLFVRYLSKFINAKEEGCQQSAKIIVDAINSSSSMPWKFEE